MESLWLAILLMTTTEMAVASVDDFYNSIGCKPVNKPPPNVAKTMKEDQDPMAFTYKAAG